MLIDFRSFFKLKEAEFLVQNFPKNDFFTPAFTFDEKKLGPNRSKIFLLSARSAKTLQFGHRFYANWSIQSREILEFVKNVKIATEIEAAF